MLSNVSLMPHDPHPRRLLSEVEPAQFATGSPRHALVGEFHESATHFDLALTHRLSFTAGASVGKMAASRARSPDGRAFAVSEGHKGSVMNRRKWMQSGLGAAACVLTAGRLRGDEPPDDSDPAPLIAKMGSLMLKIPIEHVELATGLNLIQGPGGNIAVLDGPEGLTIIDSGVPMRAKDIFETVKRVGAKPVTRLINTHWHFDHAGGNEVFARAGAMIIATAATRKRLATDQHSEVFKLTTPASPPVALPTLTSDQFDLHVGSEVLHLTAVPPAHTDGDLIVHFTAHDVIHTGDLFSNGFYPNIDGSSLGWIGGMISAADRILKLAGPKTRIIPGHGPMGTPADLTAFRKMLVTVHDRLSPLLDAGKTIQEAIASKPTSDLDPTWGKGLFTGGMFTRVAYDGLAKHRAVGQSR
jgi:cyclase